MPTQLESLLSAGHAVMVAQAPSTITFNAVTVSGVCTPINTSKRLDPTGFLDEADGAFNVTTAQATAMALADGSRGTVNGNAVRVVGILNTSIGPEVSFKHER